MNNCPNIFNWNFHNFLYPSYEIQICIYDYINIYIINIYIYLLSVWCICVLDASIIYDYYLIELILMIKYRFEDIVESCYFEK